MKISHFVFGVIAASSTSGFNRKPSSMRVVANTGLAPASITMSAYDTQHGDGMTTFDLDLLRLCKEGKITKEAALQATVRPDNFLSMLQGISVKA